MFHLKILLFAFFVEFVNLNDKTDSLPSNFYFITVKGQNEF